MKIARSIIKIPRLVKTAVTIGNFDGVHLGHQALLRQLITKAKDLSLASVVILFEPQPREFFYNKKAPKRLTNLGEKLQQLKKWPIDYVICLRFNQILAELTAVAFAKIIFETLHGKYLLLGKDFHFGYQRTGNFELLTHLALKYQSVVECFADFSVNNQRVSSTTVRQALATGDLAQANQLLGREFSLTGKVVYGKQQGRTWGIPTANIHLKNLNLPLTGVYLVKTIYQQETLFGVANIGYRPTINYDLKVCLEVHLFDFNQQIYGQRLQVFFLYKLRDEQKFDSIGSLIAQIYRDIAKAKNKLLRFK